jgi:RNA polymerase sigma-70 factor (ECF subfamily)
VISKRHLNFIESGRAHPGREMVLIVAEALDLPLRARNDLLSAAGFAAYYPERPLDFDEMKRVRNNLPPIPAENTVTGNSTIPSCQRDSVASNYERFLSFREFTRILKRCLEYRIKGLVRSGPDNEFAKDEIRLEPGAEVEIPTPKRNSSQKTKHDRLEWFNQHRPLLFGVAYRMLGSFADAEDLLQDTFIRWQQASEVEVESPRALLVTILTRLCIDHLQSARVRREEYFGQWLPEPLVTGPSQNPLIALEVDESLSLAFLLLLERLTPVERAVLVLREVFDYEYSEIAAILDQSEPNCRQILRRARQHIKQSRSRFDASRETQEELLRRFSEASSLGDLEGLVALLSKEAVFYSDGGGKAPALPKPIYGAGNIARGVLEGLRRLVPQNLVRRFVEINGQPGIVSFRDARPFSVFTLNVSGERISHIYVVTNPEKLKRIPPLASLPS